MIEDVLMSETVEQAIGQMQSSMQKTFVKKIHLLMENRGHPSLNAHRILRVKTNDIWECYISSDIRLFYEYKGKNLHLWYLGPHKVVDSIHLRSFAASTRFSRMDITPKVAESSIEISGKPQYVQSIIKPIEHISPALVENGSPNHFTFFQNAHLRVLGVPANLIQPLKNAPSLEKAMALPGLSERTRLWLEELSTSAELETVIFDSSRLLFRSTLDRLEGYCEGKIKRLMLNLQRPEQQQYVDMERAPLILLKGTAGSGKTTVGIYRAIRLAEQGRRVLVLAYNRTLSSITKSLIEELIGPLPSNLQVLTLYQFMMSQLRTRLGTLNIAEDKDMHRIIHDSLNEVRMKDYAVVLKRDEKFFEEEIQHVIKGLGLKDVEEYKAVERFGRKTALSPKQREAVWKVYETYQRRLSQANIYSWSDIGLLMLDTLNARPLDAPYDDIIVDEAQDLSPVDLRVVQQFVAQPSEASNASRGFRRVVQQFASPNSKMSSKVGNGTSIMILADAAQTLYSRGFSWKQAGLQARGRTAILRKNFRNTRQVAEAAAHLLEQNVLMHASDEYIDPEWTQRQGPWPILLKAANFYGQFELVRERILDLVSDQAFRLSDFAVLCPTNYLCEQCQRELEQSGLRTVLHKDSDFELLEERVKILTIHSAKGLEFPVVFLVGLVDGTLPNLQGSRHDEPEEAQLSIERQRVLCYVGMTRAAEALYLVTVEKSESRFVQELSRKLWQ